MQISHGASPSKQFPRLRRMIGNLIDWWNRIGSQMRFHAATVASVPNAVTNYRSELLRVIAQMGMGAGALAVVGGAIGVFGGLSLATGSIIGSQGYNQLAFIGVEAMTGLAGSLLNIRFIVPATAIIAVSATIGAGATAQLGAMRINEEIDALEVMGIRSVTYLASTQVVSGLIVVVPLYCVSALVCFFAARIMTTGFYGQAPGVYDHYFNTFLNPGDLIWSFSITVVLAVIVMLLHTYYGFNATGGPAGVGEAVGRSVRNSLVIAAVGLVMMTLAVYGYSGHFHLAS